VAALAKQPFGGQQHGLGTARPWPVVVGQQ
jgi:hypothetical protein